MSTTPAAAGILGGGSATNGTDAASILGGLQPIASTAQQPQNQPSQPSAPVQTPVQQEPVSAHRSLVGRILNSVAGILGGTSTDHVSYDENGNVQHNPTPVSHRQQVGNIVGNALRGLQAGAQQRGPGAGMRSFAAGAGAAMEHQDQQQQLQRQQAGEDFEAKQKALASQAKLRLLAFQTADLSWQMAKSKLEFQQGAINNIAAVQGLVAGDPDSHDYGVYPTEEDFYKSHPEVKSDIAKGLSQGVVRTFPVINSEGQPTGVHAFLVTPDAQHRRTTEDVTLQVPAGPELDKDGKPTGRLKWKDWTVPAGTITNDDAYRWVMNNASQQAQNALKARDEDTKKERADKYNSGGARTSGKGVAAPTAAEMTTPDALGFTPNVPGGEKEYNKRFGTFKKNADELAKTEGTYQQFQSILQDINAGKDMTGAQSVVGLFNAIGISGKSLQGQGFRITANTIDEHRKARGWIGALQAKLLDAKAGDTITPQQLRDYAGIAAQARRSQYVNLVNEAHNAGLNADFVLPTGNGQHIDQDTVDVFLYLTGNDPARAAAAAQKKGWKF